MEEVAVELGLLPLVGLDAGVLRLQLQRQEQVGVLAWGQVADLHAGKMPFSPNSSGEIRKGSEGMH